MATILTPCKVPWQISSSSSGITLIHTETDTEPDCKVVLGGGRLKEDGHTDSRRIDITFKRCYFARVGHHDDTQSIEDIGYIVDAPVPDDLKDYSQWRCATWLALGHCPDSGFYVAQSSDWLSTLPEFCQRFRHYVLDGHDGYVELIAERFAWQEWSWNHGERDDAPANGSMLGSGTGEA